MKKIAFLALIALASCSTYGVSPSPQTPSGAGAPRGAIELGDWRRASQARVAETFSQTISHRYSEGSPLAQARSDLERNSFSCSAGSGRNAPAQTCQRSMRADDCQHIWRVHLFAQGGGLARTRALYDRTCGDDRLLGG